MARLPYRRRTPASMLRAIADDADLLHLARACRRDCRDTSHPHGQPGWLIGRLSDSERDLLRALRSEDITDASPYRWQGDEP